MAPISYAKDYMGLIGVGSIDALTNAKSSFSNFSSTYVEIAAPGSSGADGIFSTYLNGGYTGMSGTSMSAPQVAGAAALVMGFLKTHGIPYTPEQIELLLQNAAVKDPALATSFASGRRLQMERLGRMLFNSTVVDSTGGFDEP
jgi:subtilisin family serine protease